MKKRTHFPLHLYNNVSAVRKSQGWPLTSLAERAHITKSNLFKIEHNQVVPSVLTALLLAKYLHVTVDELFTFEKTVVLTEEQKFDLEIKKILEESRKEKENRD